ncbi:fumarylacetoacetate hydrolase family protein [Mesorhizobium sp. CAU 1741]|uniref:2-keto-4-pentenoate hydratase n=1 Tax=Mesorhizobium sp. CAU 1741 TaxID=3140366 RepID=UPI00325ABD8D
MADIAETILQAYDDRRQIAPISHRHPSFDLEAAYGVSDRIITARMARGMVPVGWKIGFTNRTIWEEYGVHAPIWAPVYDRTVRSAGEDGQPTDLDAEAFVEPRLEPEIMFRIANVPRSDMDDRTLLGCLDGIAHGFEIVQSVYADWRFSPADTVAAAAMHGALIVGPVTPIDHAAADQLIADLSRFQIVLMCDGAEMDRGDAANVLGSPLSALRHLLAGLEARPMVRGINAGDIISTGTVTRALPISPGQTWSTRVEGLALPGMRMRVTGGEQTIARLVERAAQGRFHLENPDSCESPEAFEHAVADGSEAESALSKLLYRNPADLAEARQTIDSRTSALSQSWKNSLAP